MSILINWVITSIFVVFIVKWIDKNILNGHFAFLYPYYIFYFMTSVLTTLMIIPFAVIDRLNCVNSQRASVVLRQISYLIGIKWEVRGIEILQQDEGCVIVSNHQSSFDILGFFWIWRYFYRMAAIAKKELYYAWPFGFAAWLAGVVYIDRANSKKARQQLEETSRMMSVDRTKLLLFPEGTRNKGDVEMLEFKKGAFHMAISCQAPIMPIVISPYFFINNKTRTYVRGGRAIITALPLIPTKGLTLNDVDALKDKVRDIMLKKYREVSEELRASLPKDYPGLKNA